MGVRRETRESVACPDKTLEIALARGRYRLRLSDVTGVAPLRGLRSIPGAPATVLGLADWRGSLVTVLDLVRLLADGSAGERPWLIRLAPPLGHVALACRALPTIGGDAEDAETLVPVALVERARSGGAAEPSPAS